MTNAKLGDQGIDRSDLNAGPATPVPKLRRGNVIIAIGLKKRKCGKALDNLRGRLGSGEALQQFLKNESRRYHDIRAEQRLLQDFNLGFRDRSVTTKGERPHARIDKQGHDRPRSDL